ncbi:MAG: nucleotidyltransferase family protein [Candidatus Eiseniibacteriota bacterium]
MELSDEVRMRRSEILALAERRGARNVRLFGSAARGGARDDSDVDLLIDLEPGRTAFDLGGLLLDLEDLLGRRVDLVTEQGLHWYIRERVLREAQPL